MTANANTGAHACDRALESGGAVSDWARARVEALLERGRRDRSIADLRRAASVVAARRPARYCEATYAWWHWYFETREAVVAIVQTWGAP